MAKPKQRPATTRLNPLIAEPVVIKLVELQASLRKQGIKVSQSGLIETALQEFFSTDDVAAAIRKYGARAKRG